MDTDKKAEEVDANGANGREFGHKRRKEPSAAYGRNQRG
jgi:hypothetical protein